MSRTASLIVTTGQNAQRKLFLLEYPGLVRDEMKAIETLGGLKTLEEVHAP